MKGSTASTFVVITANRIGRTDFDGPLHTPRIAARPAGASLAECVRAALALGGKASRETWVLDSDVWTQDVQLSPAQVAGLTPEQLGRALSFEVEPFSGVAVAESATGFRDNGGGRFSVVQMQQADRDGVVRAVASAGGRLAGIVHPGAVPEDDATLAEWWPVQRAGIAAMPRITPPAPEPSPHRFLITGVALEAAALLFLFSIAGWNAVQRKIYTTQNAQFAAVAREVDSAHKRNEALRKELAALETQEKQRQQVHARRSALPALLNALAVTRGEDVVVRALTAEGQSSLVVSGLSLEAGAVDEMSIVLSQSLRAAGWTAEPRSKTGKGNMASGGPWEFALVLTHEEAIRTQSMQLSQRDAE